MDIGPPVNPNSFSARLVARFGRKVRSEKVYSESREAVEKRKENDRKKLRKRKEPVNTAPANEVNELGEREYSIFSDQHTIASTRSGRTPRVKEVDHGELMHGLAHHGSLDSLLDHSNELSIDPYAARRRRHQGMIVSQEHENRIASLPDELWKRISSFLDPVDAVHLALSTKTLNRKLGVTPFQRLNEPENRRFKHAFLHRLDKHYPTHLLCFPCAKYHKRLQPGKESLKIDYVANPVFICPLVKASILPRARLTYNRQLPYAYVQLALRAVQYGPNYGIDYKNLSRRFNCKDSGWSHRTHYMIHDNHLLVRIKSQHFTPPSKELTETAERHILYDREEYTPFFSVCAHWRDGDLMKICKCMMSHVPSPPDPYHKQLQRGFKVSKSAANPDFLVRGCDECRPARRCPECPTEYLVEVQMVEDTTDKVFAFKHAIVVTRWSDLGDGSSPYTSPEWAAINGLLPTSSTTTTGPESSAYSSFSNVGRRAVGGIFEAAISGAAPGQRLLSLNPKNKKSGEDGHGWY